MKKFFFLLLLWGGMLLWIEKGKAYSSLKSQDFETFEINGFTVKMASDCPNQNQDKKYAQAFRFLGKSLDYIYKILPEELLPSIKNYPIYVLNQKEEQPTVEFIPRMKSLKDSNVVVINDLMEFYKVSFTDLGTPLLKALAKRYYQLQMDKEQKKHIAETFRVSAHLYKEIPSVKKDADYFAFLTTSYFGVNDFAPVDYHALKEYDASGFSLMEEVWGERPLKDFICLHIEGFRVMYPIKYKDDEFTVKAIEELKKDLDLIVKMVPEQFVNLFRRKILWMDNNTEGAATYHDSVEWLKANGHMKDKSKCVEINNIEHFVLWSEKVQPLMILHEFAHMYHFSSFYDADDIASVYNHAMENRLYDQVEYFNGREKEVKKAYATNNQFEYFSELTEAYFGRNDFYPFNKEDLMKHDPEGFKLMEKIWNPDNFRE